VTAKRSLRIAMMLESDGPGGAEMMVFRLSEELRKRGHVVVPVGPAHGVGWLGQLFRESGMTPESFHIRRPLDPACVRGLVDIFRQNDIDAVHSHEFTMAVYGAAAARLLRIPHVITMHGGFRACSALRRRIALRWAMRNSDHTVMVSNATRREYAKKLGWDERRFTVVPNGVPIVQGNAARVRAEFDVGPDDRVLLAVGNLERHKGHAILLDALARLDGRGLRTPWKLIIAGGRGGPEYDRLQGFVRDEGWEDRVHIVTNRNDIPDLLALADVYVMPSLVEGMPMALLEAMVAGKAIVASKTAGIPEAISSGTEGILVTAGDVSALADALRSVISDSELRSSLGAAAAERARSQFTVPVMSERYEGLYDTVAV